MQQRSARHLHKHMEGGKDADIKAAAITVGVEHEAVAADIVHITVWRFECNLRHQEVRQHTKDKSTSPTP